jgi:hypothetical protein
MKKILVFGLILVCFSCIEQVVRTEATLLTGYSFEEVWNAAVRAVNDIDFTIDSMDRDAGFIGAEAGPHVLQEVPPRLSILIRETGSDISLDCRVLQKEQYIDLFGIGKKTVNKFMTALNMNLREHSRKS